jgi:hypothetical protein
VTAKTEKYLLIAAAIAIGYYLYTKSKSAPAAAPVAAPSMSTLAAQGTPARASQDAFAASVKNDMLAAADPGQVPAITAKPLSLTAPDVIVNNVPTDSGYASYFDPELFSL